MKLALCLEYPIDQHGGTEVLVTELIKGLAGRHQILLASPDDGASLSTSPVANLLAGHVPWKPQPHSARQCRDFARQLAGHKPDLAHFHFGGNYAWGNRAFWQCPVVALDGMGVPCLSTNHGAFSILEGYCWHKRPPAIKLALFPPAWLSKLRVLASLRTEVAVSRHDYLALRRWYWPMAGKFQFIYHSRLRPPPPPANPRRRKCILCAGTFGPRKGQPLLIEAFCRLAPKYPDWNLVLIGRHDEKAVMQPIHELLARNRLSDRVQLLGERPDEELVQWLNEAAIFAMPSLYEGLGLSLQEAQFHGCACVATKAGGVADLIQDGDNGLLVPVGQAAPLAEALERLILDEGLRARLGARAPQSVLEKEMTADKMVEKYERLYASLLS